MMDLQSYGRKRKCFCCISLMEFRLPMELWENPKSLGLKLQNANFNINCLENDKSASFDV